MALKIRLWQQGSTNKLCYRVVVADSRSPRDGKYVEAIGFYNPCGKENQQCTIQEERLQYWLSVGAQMTPTVAAAAKKVAPAVITEHAQRQNARQAK